MHEAHRILDDVLRLVLLEAAPGFLEHHHGDDEEEHSHEHCPEDDGGGA